MVFKIKKGRARWYPVIFKIIRKFNRLTFITKPNNTQVFDYKFGESLDEDWRDWKKIGGISFVNWKNLRNIFIKNRDSVILAWRWNPVIETFEYCVYENKGGKNYPYESITQILRAKQGEEVYLNIDLTPKNQFECYLYTLENRNVNPIVIKPRQKFTFYSYINMWYGGGNNSAGPWGGKAPKDMECEATFFLT